MAVADSTLSARLLGRSVVITVDLLGVPVQRSGSVIGFLDVLPGSRATPSILLDHGSDCEFFDQDEITSIFVE